VTGKERPLRKSGDVEVSLEGIVSINSGTSLLCLSLEVCEDGGLGSISDLKAEGVSFSLIGDLLHEVLHSWVDAGIPESVEDSSREGSRISRFIEGLESASTGYETADSEGFHSFVF
jgi:hypothetical protein